MASGPEPTLPSTEARYTVVMEEKGSRDDIFDGGGGPTRYFAWKKKIEIMERTKWSRKSDLEKVGEIIDRMRDTPVNTLPDVSLLDGTSAVWRALDETYGQLGSKSDTVEQLSRCRMGGDSFDTFKAKLDGFLARNDFSEEEKVGHLRAGLPPDVAVMTTTCTTYGTAVAAARAACFYRRVTRTPANPQYRGRGRGRGGRGNRGGRGWRGGYQAAAEQLEGAQAAGSSQSGNPSTGPQGGCWGCGGPHFQSECPSNRRQGNGRGRGRGGTQPGRRVEELRDEEPPQANRAQARYNVFTPPASLYSD